MSQMTDCMCEKWIKIKMHLIWKICNKLIWPDPDPGNNLDWLYMFNDDDYYYYYGVCAVGLVDWPHKLLCHCGSG